ncbi:hypothetical protein [Anaerocolumna jejuensis]
MGMEKDNEGISEPTMIKNIELVEGDGPVIIEVFMPSIKKIW